MDFDKLFKNLGKSIKKANSEITDYTLVVREGDTLYIDGVASDSEAFTDLNLNIVRLIATRFAEVMGKEDAEELLKEALEDGLNEAEEK